jgi:transposase
MPRVTQAARHLSEEDIAVKLKRAQGLWLIQRWMVIRHALVDPQPAKVIALHVGVAEQTVHNLISAYNRFGVHAVETPGKGRQRQRAYLTLDEERALLAPFMNQARHGQITTISSIKGALEERLGHAVHATTVYRLLERHGYRKVVPRPRHIEMDEAQQEAFKKTLPSAWQR